MAELAELDSTGPNVRTLPGVDDWTLYRALEGQPSNYYFESSNYNFDLMLEVYTDHLPAIYVHKNSSYDPNAGGFPVDMESYETIVSSLKEIIQQLNN